MKIKCPKCSIKFQVLTDSLKKRKSPFINCPKCPTIIILKPSKARCFHCNHLLKYYKYDFAKDNNIVQCNHCNGYNKLSI